MKKLVTVLTPTYNRKKYLPKLFESLMNQSNLGFKWLIIDDGSTDGTDELIQTFIEKSEFEIRYLKKDNGGKHTALNLGFDTIDTVFTFIVDSDDILRIDAIQSIYDNKERVINNNLCGMSFLRGYSDTERIGDLFPEDNAIFNGIDIQFRHKIKGDKAEVWRTDILKEYRFPVFEGERFQGENYIWWQIARKYDMLYLNKIIYITEYLEGGLSLSGKKMRIRNPLGGMANSSMAFYKEFPLWVRIKYAMLYVCYGYFAKLSLGKMIITSNANVLIALSSLQGYILYKYWKAKYGD